MGMNVYGQSPISVQGYYFRGNLGEWEALWQYCEQLAPDLIPADNLGHTNDGWGLDGQDAQALADRLAGAMASGETRRHEESCHGKDDLFSVENVREFALFLRNCGGFSIL
jgi:hypothetical protein